jgi:hypothetical protein
LCRFVDGENVREEHVEQVFAVLKRLYRKLPNEDSLRTALLELNLKTGPSELGKRRDPRSRWIAKARVFAREYALQHGQVNIHIIREHEPLPVGVDVRATGGVLKHPDFVRIGHESKRMPNGRLKTIGVYGLSEVTSVVDGEDDEDDEDYPRFS